MAVFVYLINMKNGSKNVLMNVILYQRTAILPKMSGKQRTDMLMRWIRSAVGGYWSNLNKLIDGTCNIQFFAANIVV